MAFHIKVKHRRLAERLATLPLFAGIEFRALQALAARLNWQRLPAGELLFDQGDPANALYLLIYGRLAALQPASVGMPIAIASSAAMPGPLWKLAK